MRHYSEATLRKKAYFAGYQLRKGFTHYLQWDTVYTNMWGERFTGYELWDLSTNTAVLGVDANFDYNATLEEVNEFLKDVYEKSSLKW